MSKFTSFLKTESPHYIILLGGGYLAGEILPQFEQIPDILLATMTLLTTALSYGLYGKWENDRVDDKFHEDIVGCTNRVRDFGQLLFKLSGGLCAGSLLPETVHLAKNIADIVN